VKGMGCRLKVGGCWVMGVAGFRTYAAYCQTLLSEPIFLNP